MQCATNRDEQVPRCGPTSFDLGRAQLVSGVFDQNGIPATRDTNNNGQGYWLLDTTRKTGNRRGGRNCRPKAGKGSQILFVPPDMLACFLTRLDQHKQPPQFVLYRVNVPKPDPDPATGACCQGQQQINGNGFDGEDTPGRIIAITYTGQRQVEGVPDAVVTALRIDYERSLLSQEQTPRAGENDPPPVQGWGRHKRRNKRPSGRCQDGGQRDHHKQPSGRCKTGGDVLLYVCDGEETGYEGEHYVRTPEGGIQAKQSVWTLMLRSTGGGGKDQHIIIHLIPGEGDGGTRTETPWDKDLPCPDGVPYDVHSFFLQKMTG